MSYSFLSPELISHPCDRSVQDLQLMAQVFRLEDRDDILPLSGNRPLRIGVCRSPAWQFTSPETRTVFAAVSRTLALSGAEMTQIELPSSFDNILALHSTIFSSEIRATCLAPYTIASVLPSQDPPLIHPDFEVHVMNKTNISRKKLLDAYDQVAALKPILDQILGQFDAVLTPSAPDVAPGIEG